MRYMINFLKNILLLVCMTAIALLAAEGLVRWILPQRLTYQRENRYTTAENFLNWTGRNRTEEYDVYLHFNGQGIRGEEISYQKTPGTFRVMFLGDSYVESAQVNWKDHFSQVVQNMMNRLYPHKVQIINYGVAGWETVQELIYFKNEGYKFSPDVLYLFVFPFNDIDGNYTRYYNEQLRNYVDRSDLDLLYRRAERGSWLLHLKEYLLTHSHLFTLFKIALQKTGLRQYFESMQRRLHIINIPVRQDFGSPLHDQGKMEEAWRLFRVFVGQLRDECRKHGVSLKAITIPYDQSGSPRFKKGYSKQVAGNMGVEGYQKVKNILVDEKIPTIDLMPFMEASKEQLYFYKDGHWTPAGQKVVAKVISEDLVASLGAQKSSPGVNQNMAVRQKIQGLDSSVKKAEALA